METLWFGLLSTMLAVYVVLDGFDFGVGILHLFVAKTDEERRTVFASIGPVWDGNEVWLVASGGLLVYAFPKAYAAGFSGFYLPLMMALWLLILRGLSIEFRSLEKNPLWRSFWDGTFTFASTLMTVILGAALGCIIRGVPLEKEGYFSGPLFTNFQPGGRAGVLDWYTVLVGVFALAVLAGHGTLYLNWKTTGPVQTRAHALARRLWIGIVALGVLTTVATAKVQPLLYPSLLARPWTIVLALGMVGGLGLVFVHLREGREFTPFLGSAIFIACLLAATAAGMYPHLLISTLDPTHSLTAFNATAGGIGLQVGLMWWTPAILLAIGYFTYLFRSVRGKVKLDDYGHG